MTHNRDHLSREVDAEKEESASMDFRNRSLHKLRSTTADELYIVGRAKKTDGSYPTYLNYSTSWTVTFTLTSCSRSRSSCTFTNTFIKALTAQRFTSVADKMNLWTKQKTTSKCVTFLHLRPCGAYLVFMLRLKLHQFRVFLCIYPTKIFRATRGQEFSPCTRFVTTKPGTALNLHYNKARVAPSPQ